MVALGIPDTEALSRIIMDALDRASKALLGNEPFKVGNTVLHESYTSLAEYYLKEENGDRIAAANSLIRWQCAKSGISGAITSLPGIFSAPVSIPADIAVCLYLQLRMVFAICKMSGRDPLDDDKVRVIAIGCLAGDAVRSVLTEVGVRLGKEFITQAIKRLPGKALIEINKAVGFRLVTKFGEMGVLNLGKMVPLVAAPIAAGINGWMTNSVGNVARDIFLVELGLPATI